MRAELRRIHSPDVPDLPSWAPASDDWAILLQLLVGPHGLPGEESFDLTVCTLGWITVRVQKEGIVDLRHHVVVSEFDYDRLDRYLRKRVAACQGETWEQVAMGLNRLAHWEFEDYR